MNSMNFHCRSRKKLRYLRIHISFSVTCKRGDRHLIEFPSLSESMKRIVDLCDPPDRLFGCASVPAKIVSPEIRRALTFGRVNPIFAAPIYHEVICSEGNKILLFLQMPGMAGGEALPFRRIPSLIVRQRSPLLSDLWNFQERVPANAWLPL